MRFISSSERKKTRLKKEIFDLKIILLHYKNTIGVDPTLTVPHLFREMNQETFKKYFGNCSRKEIENVYTQESLDKISKRILEIQK